jgi:queuine tRNA-ribosyltransferase
VEIGFDGYGFGGWPVGPDGQLLRAVQDLPGLLPPGSLLHGLGIGKPESLVRAYHAGYQTFDCVLPTRDARHKRLYCYLASPETADLADAGFYQHLYVDGGRYRRDKRPPDETCDCPTCTRYSRAYLHHLDRIGDPLAQRLATLHNLRFYSRLVEELGRRSGESVS